MVRKEVSQVKVLGADPGNTGAIALYDGERVTVEDMPTITTEKTTKTASGKNKLKTVIEIASLRDILRYSLAGWDHAYIEDVTAMKGQGVTSMFTFGRGMGNLEAAIRCEGEGAVHYVTSTKWKMECGLNNDGEKSRLRALQIFPKDDHYFKRKMDHGRAEAALIAWYGYQLNTIGRIPR